MAGTSTDAALHPIAGIPPPMAPAIYGYHRHPWMAMPFIDSRYYLITTTTTNTTTKHVLSAARCRHLDIIKVASLYQNIDVTTIYRPPRSPT